MKKITFLCLVLLLVCALAVPCFASDEELVKFTWSDKSLSELVPQLSNSTETEYIDFTVGETNYIGFRFADVAYFSGMYYIIDEETEVLAWHNKNGFTEGLQTIVVSRSFGEANGIFGSYVPLYVTSYNEFSQILSAYKEQITVQSVVQVLVVGATAVVGLVFMWWGVRKLSRALFKAFRKGKVSV